MHRRVHHSHRHLHGITTITVAVVATGALLASACTSSSGDATETPTPLSISPTTTGVPAGSPTTVATVTGQDESAIRQPWPDGQPVEQTEWVQDRLTAVKQIYGFTPAGEEWIDGYDFRQMAEQPAWFGSHGYDSWAGAGEAVPRSVLHELGHSYWGAFSIEGRPNLDWDRSEGTAPAFQSFRDDLEIFMDQPPDRFEPLRDRFRNLPRLNSGDYPDLFHFGEANLLYMTGGNALLIPPILRKYVSGYLLPQGVGPGPDGYTVASWDVAISWFNSLSGDDRRIAGEVFGLQHFPAGPYRNLPDVSFDSGSAGVTARLRTLYEGEEKQRLIDFSLQLDGILEREFSLLDAAGADRGFDFWRSYLSDKLNLHIRYPQFLSELGSQRATELSAALDLYSDITSLSAQQQVNRYRQAQDQPLVPELAVLLKPRAVVELFADVDSADGIAAVLGGRAERLTALVDAVERVGAANSTAEAVAELEQHMRSVPEDQLRADMFLLLDLLRSADNGLANRVLPALSNESLVLLLNVQPAAVRAPEIGPKRLLEAVGITSESSLNEIAGGAQILSSNSSGNFSIDTPYDAAVFTHLDRFVEIDPSGVLAAFGSSEMRFVPWISRSSDGALRAMRSVPETAAGLLLELTGSRESAERIIHLVAKSDPELAADLTVSAMNTHGVGAEFLVLALGEFTYDAYWSERSSGPNVEPERFAEIVEALTDRVGDDSVVTALSELIDTLVNGAEIGELDTGGTTELERTIAAALDAASGQTEDRFREINDRLSF